MLLCLLIVACKKKTSTPVNTVTNSFIKTQSYMDNNKQVVKTIYRDANGRAIKVEGSDTTSFTIEYVSANLIVVKEYTKDSLVSTTKSTLNEKGYILYDERTENNSTSIDTNYYDPNGYELDFINQQITVENGNVTKRISKNNDTTFYTFDLTKSNTIGILNLAGTNWYGLDDKNLVISEKVGANSTYITQYQYIYEFDAKNRVIKKTTSRYSNGTKQGTDDVETFTYTD